MYNELNVSILKGKVLASIEGRQDGDCINFTLESGEVYKLYHRQDCCESVSIEDIIGNLEDLIGLPLLVAEEVSSEGTAAKDHYDLSYTWTFYKFATARGYVDIRWYGTSNGYYSERVDFVQVK